MEELREMVERIIRRFRPPYPEDITDQVFLIIERDVDLLREYRFLADGDYGTTNVLIAKYVADITRLRTNGRQCSHPQSSLIKSFHYLVYR